MIEQWLYFITMTEQDKVCFLILPFFIYFLNPGSAYKVCVWQWSKGQKEKKKLRHFLFFKQHRSNNKDASF